MRCLAIPFALLAMVGSQSHALELQATAVMTSEYTNNAANSESNKQHDVQLEPGIELEASHETATLNLDAQYRVERRMFLEDIFEDETVVLGNGSLQWIALPERFMVEASQDRTETSRSIAGTGAIDDRRIRSRSRVIPTLMFNVRGTDQLRLSYEYRDRRSTEADIDNTTHTAAASYFYTWGPATSWVARVSRSDIEYENSFTPDLEVEEGTLGFTHTSGRNYIEATGGYSTFKRDTAEDVDGAIGSITYRRQFALDSDIVFRASREITDDSSSLIQDLQNIQNTFLGFENADLSEVLVQTYGDVTLNLKSGANAYYISGSYAFQDYEDLPADTERFDVTIGVDRNIRRNLTGRAYLRRFEILEDLSSSEYVQYDLYAEADWQPLRQLSLVGGVGYTKRSESIFANYNRFYVTFEVEYLLHPR